MSVDKPESGQTITKQSVIDMHDTIRKNINKVDENYIGHSSFSFEQMSTSASPLVAFDQVNDNGGSPITVTTAGTSDTAANVTSWQELTAYRLDNGGSGFTTTTASTYVVFFTCRVTSFTNGSGVPVAADPKVHIMFALAHEDNGGTITVIDTSIMGYGAYGTNPMTTDYVTQEIPVAIWCSFSFATSKIIDRIRVYTAMMKGSAAATPTDYKVERGTAGCLVFERV